MLLAALLLALPAARPQEPAEMQPEQGAAFVVETEFESLALKEYWPGFWALEYPVAVYDGERTWLWRHPYPPEGFRKVEDRPRLRVYAGQHEQMRANTSVDLNGVQTATLLLPAGADTDKDLHSLAAVLMHEVFHVFQRREHPHWSANEAQLFLYPVQDAGILANRRLECAALRRALAAVDDDGAAAWAAAALQLRRARFEMLSGGEVAYERGTELNEGLAQYVQQLALGRAAEWNLPAGGYPAAQVRQRGYGTGTALALLLDRLSPGWKEAFEKGGAPQLLDQYLDQALLARGVRTAAFPEPEAAAVRAQAAQDAAALQESWTAMRRDFLAQPGWTVVVEVHGHDYFFPAGFDPLNVHRVAAGEVLHSRWLKLKNQAGELELLQRPVLTSGAGDHPLFNGVKRVIVTGLPEAPVTTDAEGAMRITAAGFEAVLVPTELRLEGQTLTVILGAPEEEG